MCLEKKLNRSVSTYCRCGIQLNDPISMFSKNDKTILVDGVSRNDLLARSEESRLFVVIILSCAVVSD